MLRPDGTFLVAVPADPRLWSDHDVAVDHVRRYTRETLSSVLHRGGFDIAAMTSWNVLLRPVVALRRKQSSGSDLDDVHPVVNSAAHRDHHRGAVPTGQAAPRREPAGHGPPARLRRESAPARVLTAAGPAWGPAASLASGGSGVSVGPCRPRVAVSES